MCVFYTYGGMGCNNSKNKLEKAIGSINSALKETTESLEKNKGERTELEKKTTSIKPTCDAINNYLKDYNFNSFSLHMTDDEHSYCLCRHDGSPALETLSEGEKSFVSFLYFYTLLQGSHSNHDIKSDCVVVLDDSVSSLDKRYFIYREYAD